MIEKTESEIANECQYLGELVNSYRNLVSQVVRGEDMCLHEGTEMAVCDFVMSPNHRLKEFTDAKKIIYDNYATPYQDFSEFLNIIKKEESDGFMEFDEFGRVLKD